MSLGILRLCNPGNSSWAPFHLQMTVLVTLPLPCMREDGLWTSRGGAGFESDRGPGLMSILHTLDETWNLSTRFFCLSNEDKHPSPAPRTTEPDIWLLSLLCGLQGDKADMLVLGSSEKVRLLVSVALSQAALQVTAQEFHPRHPQFRSAPCRGLWGPFISSTEHLLYSHDNAWMAKRGPDFSPREVIRQSHFGRRRV